VVVRERIVADTAAEVRLGFGRIATLHHPLSTV
jgi:hypothetical protein